MGFAIIIVSLHAERRDEAGSNEVLTDKTQEDMATIVLQVPDEGMVTKVKQACKMLMGVASVKVQKPKEDDITKTAGYRAAMDDVKNGRVTTYASLEDFYKEMGL